MGNRTEGTSEGERKICHERLDSYEKVVKERIKKVRSRIDQGYYRDDAGHKTWLEKFAKGRGLDICCGNIPMMGAEGVDKEFFFPKTGSGGLGPLCHLRQDGDSLPQFSCKEIDFIISNYLEAMPSPLGALNEWYRILKPGGTLALVMSNAEKYDNELGPFCNKNKCNVFTPTTILLYLKRTGFEEIKLEEYGASIRVSAKVSQKIK
jgi:SAM-dependent methyltransferase